MMGPSPPPREKKCLRKPLWRYSRSNSTNSTPWHGWNSNNKHHGPKSHLVFSILRSHILQSWLSEATTDHTTNVKRLGSQHTSDSSPGRLLLIILRLAVLFELCSVTCLSSLAITFPQASQMILWIRDHQGSHSKCSREG